MYGYTVALLESTYHMINFLTTSSGFREVVPPAMLKIRPSPTKWTAHSLYAPTMSLEKFLSVQRRVQFVQQEMHPPRRLREE